jgi:hypothetical protein
MLGYFQVRTLLNEGFLTERAHERWTQQTLTVNFPPRVSNGITCLPPKQADPSRSLELKREHRFIKNRQCSYLDGVPADDTRPGFARGRPPSYFCSSYSLLLFIEFVSPYSTASEYRVSDSVPAYPGHRAIPSRQRDRSIHHGQPFVLLGPPCRLRARLTLRRRVSPSINA